MHSKRQKKARSISVGGVRSTKARGKYVKSSTPVETSVLLLAIAISVNLVQSFTKSDSVREWR